MRVWIAIWTGSTVLCGRIGAWIAGGWAPRVLGLLLAAGFLKGVPRTTEIALVLAAGWLVTAIVLGLRAPAVEQPAAPVEEPKLTPEKVTAALHQLAAPHVQLAPLAEALGSTTGDTRRVLQGMGVPVAGGVRMKGRGVSTGVKAKHFPPLSPAAAPGPTPVVTSSNNSDEGTPEKGLRVEAIGQGGTVVHDPAEAHRHHALRTH